MDQYTVAHYQRSKAREKIMDDSIPDYMIPLSEVEQTQKPSKSWFLAYEGDSNDFSCGGTFIGPFATQVDAVRYIEQVSANKLPYIFLLEAPIYE